MAQVKNAVAIEGIPVEEEVASTPSAAADNPRKILSHAEGISKNEHKSHAEVKITYAYALMWNLLCRK
jgi:hypothetical protein